MATERKCLNCGYTFTASDKNICPECLCERKMDTVQNFNTNYNSNSTGSSYQSNQNYIGNQSFQNNQSFQSNQNLHNKNIQNKSTAYNVYGKNTGNVIKIWILIITFIIVGLVAIVFINTSDEKKSSKASAKSGNSSVTDSKKDKEKDDDYTYDYKSLSLEKPITEEGYVYTYHSVQKIGKTCEKAVAKNGYCFIEVKSTVKNTSKNISYTNRPLDIYDDKDNFYQQYDYFGEISFQTPDSLAIKPFQSVEVTSIFEVPENAKKLVLCHVTDLEDHGIEYSMDISDIIVKLAV